MFIELAIRILAEIVKKIGLLGIFFTMALESMAIPIPSEVVMPLASFTLCHTIYDVIFISLLASLANLVGSTAAYYIGLLKGSDFFKKYGKYFLIKEKELTKAEEIFRNHGRIIVLFSRMMPAIRTFISIPAGTFKMNYLVFATYTVLGSILWNLALAYLGFVLRENWILILNYSRYLDIVALLVIVISIAYIRLKGNNVSKRP